MNAAIGRVGFVGIDTMGWPMAADLVRAGFDVAHRRSPRWTTVDRNAPPEYLDSALTVTPAPDPVLVN